MGLKHTPEKILPVHFQNLIDLPEWNDVTPEHKDAIEITIKLLEIKKDFNEQSDMQKKLQLYSSQHVNTYNKVAEVLNALDSFSSKIEAKNVRKTEVTYSKSNIDFWNVKQPDSDNPENSVQQINSVDLEKLGRNTG